MKRIIAIALVLLLAAPASAEVVYRRKNRTTVVTISNVTTAGKFYTSGTDTWTLQCGCAAENSAITLGTCCSGAGAPDASCTGATSYSRDGTTANYNFTVNAGDVDNDFCQITAVPSTVGNADHVIDIRTRFAVASFAIENPSGDALSISATGSNGNGVSLAGNGTGAGLFSQGGSTGDGAQFVSNGLAYSSAQAGMTIKTNANSTAGLNVRGAGTSPAVYTQGGSTASAIQVVGGATSGEGIYVSTTSGDGVSVQANGSNKSALYLNGATGANARGLRIAGFQDAILVAPTNGVAISCTGNNCTSQVGLGNRRD